MLSCDVSTCSDHVNYPTIMCYLIISNDNDFRNKRNRSVRDSQLLKVKFNNVLFLMEPLHDITQGCKYMISDPFCIDSRYFCSHKKKSYKFDEFDCPAL